MISSSPAHIIKEITYQLPPHLPNNIRQCYAHWIIEHVTQKPLITLFTLQEITLTSQQATLLSTILYNMTHLMMPLAYALTSVPFHHLTLTVKPPILIPRKETELWLADLIETLHPFKDDALTLFDVGTGSGCIALTLAHLYPRWTIYAVDINPEALNLARHNGLKHNIHNVKFILSDLFTHIPSSVKADMIISNPPYIPEEEWAKLDPSVKEWEDYHALCAQEEGLFFITNIIRQSPQYFNNHSPLLKSPHIPQLVLECGYNQGSKIKQILASYNYTHVIIENDLAHHNRVVKARHAL